MTQCLTFIIGITAGLFFPRQSQAQSVQVPYHIQAALYGKIFRHIPQFENNTQKILIVYDTQSEQKKSTFMENIESLGFEADAVEPDKLVSEISGYDVVYFMPGLQKYAQLCEERKKLSICGMPEYIENGMVSIALGIENDKPRIYINIGHLRAEGKDVTAELLSVSYVF